VNRVLVALLASFIIGSVIGESTEPTEIRITTWNLEWFPNRSPRGICPVKPLRLGQISLNVQANMIESRNGQSHARQSKPTGRFTGERLLRERPRVYRKVVELLAEPGMSINQIRKLCRVSEHNVRALRDREAISIAERKQRLMSIFANVAEMAAERMEELAAQASLRDAGTTAGIATDKLLALSSDLFSQANNHLHVHLESVNLIEQWNQMVAALPHVKPIATEPTEGSAREEKDRAKGEQVFTVVFYGLEIFGCKTTQVCVKRCEVCWSKYLASATVCKPVKTGAKTLS
jgi:hypothetical protein